MVVLMMVRKEHLTIQGLQKIMNMRATLNWGLTDELKKAFPDTIPVIRPLVEQPQSLDHDWIAGFVSGEGCFMIKIKPSITKLALASSFFFTYIKKKEDWGCNFFFYIWYM
jgi:hypothetical protein